MSAPISITVSATVNVPIDQAWIYWTLPQHILQWNAASDDWHTTHAENNLVVGGQFVSRMASKDEQFAFDFKGTYTKILLHQQIAYVLEDARTVTVLFEAKGESTIITEIFDAETENPTDMQQAGWQAILNRFCDYAQNQYAK